MRAKELSKILSRFPKKADIVFTFSDKQLDYLTIDKVAAGFDQDGQWTIVLVHNVDDAEEIDKK